MYRKIVVLLALLFVLVGPGYAQVPTPEHTDPFWQAAYWNNRDLAGNPAVQVTETTLDWNWGSGGPAGVGADNFSARWTRYFDLPAGPYRLSITVDDGARVYVDNNLVINQWSDHPAQTFTADVNLTAGHHYVVVEYYEHGGQAMIRFSLDAQSPPIQNWRGEYYNNPNLSGNPVFVRDDANINFDWAAGAPAANLPADNFSVRWTRTVNFPAGNYRFTTTTDDGVRLWVNNHLLIDQWHNQAVHAYSEVIFVSGNTPIEMTYYENGGQAVARLSWALDGGGGNPGTYIIDETSAGFTRGGDPAGWHTANLGYGNTMLWTRNNDTIRPNYNWARWYPNVPAGRYELFVYIPANYATTGQARYWVSHRNGFTLRLVDQNDYSNEWLSLGTYWFRGNNQDYLSLSDVTYEPRLAYYVGFDAAKWESR